MGQVEQPRERILGACAFSRVAKQQALWRGCELTAS